MTTEVFWMSYAAAWALLIALSGGLLVLFRFSVRAFRTHAPIDVGDAFRMSGPLLDTEPPPLDLRNLTNERITLGPPTGTPHFIVFAKSTCPKCKIALELLRSFSAAHAVETTVVCGGNQRGIEDCASLAPSPLTVVADFQWKGATRWGVSHMPFGVVLDQLGVVRAKGDPTSTAMLMILTRELESRADAARADATRDIALVRRATAT